VGKKTFALHWNDRVILKLDKAHQELLFEARPEVFSPMIVGPMRWSRVDIDALERDELAELVLEAWAQIVPKKVSKAYAGRR
jgi:hypothetical protein